MGSGMKRRWQVSTEDGAAFFWTRFGARRAFQRIQLKPMESAILAFHAPDGTMLVFDERYKP